MFSSTRRGNPLLMDSNSPDNVDNKTCFFVVENSTEDGSLVGADENKVIPAEASKIAEEIRIIFFIYENGR